MTTVSDLLKPEDITAAGKRIEGFIRRTPMEPCPALSEMTDTTVALKLECWQQTGSFKVRGAINKVLCLSDKEKERGLITASAGNHGLGVAYAAGLFGVRTTLVLPTHAASTKVEALRRYKDVTLIQAGQDYDEAEEIARRLAQEKNLVLVHAFDDPVVIAGQGTVGLEIVQEFGDVDTVVVPIGGGGLIAGTAVAVKNINPRTRVIGVQSVASPAMYRSLLAGQVVETPIQETIADGLAGRFVSELTLTLAKNWVDDVVLVEEEEIKRAMVFLLKEMHLVVEGSAAVGVAALLFGKITPGKQTAVVLTGRNIDAATVKTILNRYSPE